MGEENKFTEMKYYKRRKVKISEDYCFVCKDGGFLLECEHKDCLKSYHPECVGKDESFAKFGSSWTCGRHSCFICKKRSRLQCFCCPTSVCRACMSIAEFVQVKKVKGFCNNCLKLATLSEQNVDVDSDGDEVDFDDTETYEFLFKDYWQIVKEQEAITLEDLCKARALLKRGEHWINGSDSDGLSEEDVTSDVEKMENNCNVEDLAFTKSKRQNATMKGSRFKKRNFIGWGSEELIGFLSSIGRDTKEPLTQLDVSEVIKGYIQKNNLLLPGKKKKVECDDKLHSLFRKKSLKLNKIYNLLESHFVANEDFTDDSDFVLEEDDNLMEGKRMRKTSSDTHKSMLRNSKEKVIKPSGSCYAAIVDKNIKLVYLKKSLIQEFLKNIQTFESKMLGSFVRIKLDHKDYHYSINKTHLLRQVTGIKKATAVYKLGEMSTDIVLRVSNMWNDIHISMLSDDDFEEEECEELRQLVRNGHLKRITIAELEDKARRLHEDIVRHWLNKEIVALQRKIDRANEKGWYNQKIECIDQRELLRTPGEQTRLLSEIPNVIPDTEVELEGSQSHPELRSQSRNEGIGAPSNEKIAERECEGTAAASNVSGHLMAAGIGAPFNEKIPVGESEAASNSAGCLITRIGASFSEKDAEKTDEGDKRVEVNAIVPRILDFGDPAYFEKDAERKSDGFGASPKEITAVIKTEEGGQFRSTPIEIPDDEDDSESGHKVTSGIEIINLDDEDGFDPVMGSANMIPEAERKANVGPDALEEGRKSWHYMDPHGNVQGPFSIMELARWKNAGFFDHDFRVWKVGQSQSDAILLTRAIQQIKTRLGVLG